MSAQPVATPSKFWAYVAVVVGWLLLVGGAVTTLGYLGRAGPLVTGIGSVMVGQLGSMAVMFVGLICGGLAVVHGLGAMFARSSRPLKLPPTLVIGLAFAATLGLGNLLLNFDAATAYVFPVLFLLGAALPTVGVVAWTARRLSWPISWRQAALALVAGSTLSIGVALVLESFLPYLAYLLVAPLEQMGPAFSALVSGGAPGLLERLLLSPLIIVFLITTALAAPIPEEFAKALGLALFGRARLITERQVLLVGMASGAGFAIMENMLYEGLYAQQGGWSWGGITLLRGLGAGLHPVCTGLVALGWFRMRTRGVRGLLLAYAAAVGVHTLWNGGFQVLVFLTGLDLYTEAGATLTLYGTAVEIGLVVYLVTLSLGLWWLMGRLVTGLGRGVQPDLTPTHVSRRALAGWALVCAATIVPLGAVLGPAWNEIRAVLLTAP